MPFLKRSPHIVVERIGEFLGYFGGGPVDPANVPCALRMLAELAEQVPESRTRIVEVFGPTLFDYKLMANELPFGADVLRALAAVELAVTAEDGAVQAIARSIVRLGQPIIVVIGAGFSYDTMPITSELRPLLVPILREAGMENPIEMIQHDDEGVWRTVAQNSDEFKQRFAGWCARSAPSFQHRALTRMIHDGHVALVASFNWDDLCERAYQEQFGQELLPVTADQVSDAPLWKLHGDVNKLGERWVWPYEQGVVFDALIARLDQLAQAANLAHAVIVGYSEQEPVVQDKLIGWLEAHVPNVLRVRPNWPHGTAGGIDDSARRFFERLVTYTKLA